MRLWQRALAENGLRRNVKKTKFISCDQRAGSILDYKLEAIENVEEFRYLGTDLSEEGTVDQAVREQRLRRFRGTRKASESPKEKVEGRHQEISQKSANDALYGMRWRQITTVDPPTALN